MPDIHHLVQILLHFDQYLIVFLQQYGAWVYALLFLILFAETGLVIMPVLPGDSMLFICGTLAGAGIMNAPWLLGLLVTAAVLGDAVNYWVGHRWGVRLFGGRLLNVRYLDTTQRFYARHGGKTVIIARFFAHYSYLRTFCGRYCHYAVSSFLWFQFDGRFPVGGGLAGCWLFPRALSLG